MAVVVEHLFLLFADLSDCFQPFLFLRLQDISLSQVFIDVSEITLHIARLLTDDLPDLL